MVVGGGGMAVSRDQITNTLWRMWSNSEGYKDEFEMQLKAYRDGSLANDQILGTFSIMLHLVEGKWKEREVEERIKFLLFGVRRKSGGMLFASKFFPSKNGRKSGRNDQR